MKDSFQKEYIGVFVCLFVWLVLFHIHSNNNQREKGYLFLRNFSSTTGMILEYLEDLLVTRTSNKTFFFFSLLSSLCFLNSIYYELTLLL